CSWRAFVAAAVSAAARALSACAYSRGFNSFGDAMGRGSLPAAAISVAFGLQVSANDAGEGCILGTGKSACENSDGASSWGEITTRSPILVSPHRRSAEPEGRRIHPCEAG